MRTFSIILPNYSSIVHEQKNNRQIWFIAPKRASKQSISSKDRKPDHTSKTFCGRAELGSHTDQTVASRNWNVLHHT